MNDTVTRAEVDAAYDKIDRYLRNNLDDLDYALYSDALEVVYIYGSVAVQTKAVSVPSVLPPMSGLSGEGEE